MIDCKSDTWGDLSICFEEPETPEESPQQSEMNDQEGNSSSFWDLLGDEEMVNYDNALEV